jgi:hypothetical protein
MKPSRHASGLEWVIERLEVEPSFVRKSMFGCEACYLHGRLALVIATRKAEPWQGILIPTEVKFHEPLALLHKGLVRHSVLGKWLYLPRSFEHFEETARAITERVVAGDPMIGVSPKNQKKAGARAGTRAPGRRKTIRVR